jgi:asparagine N-glycosylation enzyme membrane subunit Stt3
MQAGPLAFIGIVGLIVFSSNIADGFNLLIHSRNIQELRFLSVLDIIGYLFVVITLVIGFIVIARRKFPPDLMLLTWIIVSIILGLIAARLIIYMAPAVCIVAGIGLIKIFDIPKPSTRQALLGIIAFGVILSLITSFFIPANATMSRNWENALIYVRDETPENSYAISWWDHGFWIEDVAERQALAYNKDNLINTCSADELIASIYCASSEGAVVEILNSIPPYMEVGCIIFSTREKHYWNTIAGYMDYPVNRDTFYWQVLSEDYQPEVLDVVYHNSTVVVLDVISCGCLATH